MDEKAKLQASIEKFTQAKGEIVDDVDHSKTQQAIERLLAHVYNQGLEIELATTLTTMKTAVSGSAKL